MQVIVDGLLTQYEMSGKGPVVVLLHGWGDQASGLHSLAEALATNYTVITPDLPGFGATGAPPTTWGLDDYAVFTANFLRKLATKNVYAFVGHSNGGAIAIRGLAKGNLNAERLVLLASAGIRGEYKGRVKAVRYITKLGKALSTPLPSVAKAKLRQKVYKTVGSDMLVAEHLQETFKRVVTDDVQTDAAKLRLPTLLIYGEKDMQAPLYYGQKFHELIADSTLEVLPGVGHFPHLERPSEVKKAVQEFLK
jgi:pimeloyl-ACP methyl ester carboxylesterase